MDRQELNSLKAGLTLLETIAGIYPNDFQFLEHPENKRYFFDLLAGTKRLREVVLRGETQSYLESCTQELETFEKRRKPYLLY